MYLIGSDLKERMPHGHGGDSWGIRVTGCQEVMKKVVAEPFSTTTLGYKILRRPVEMNVGNRKNSDPIQRKLSVQEHSSALFKKIFSGEVPGAQNFGY